MPLTTPVYSALDILEDALLAALAPIVPAYAGGAAVWWQQAPDGTNSRLLNGTLASATIASLQDDGGQRGYVGLAGWRGLVLIRTHSASRATARAVQAAIPTALAALTAPEGYSIGAQFVRPVAVPPGDRLIMLASLWRITIQRADSAPTPTPGSPMLDFSQAGNSQYIPLVF